MIGLTQGLDAKHLPYFVIAGRESNKEYNLNADEILMLLKDGNVTPISKVAGLHLNTDNIYKYFLLLLPFFSPL